MDNVDNRANMHQAYFLGDEKMAENENIENENQEQVSIDELENAVNALVDGDTNTEDNNTSASFEAEKAFGEMASRIDNLESENQRLTSMVAKMVTAYGARMSENNNGPEAFPSKVENTFENPGADKIPQLGDIVLGK